MRSGFPLPSFSPVTGSASCLMAELRIIFAPPGTTVQDGGRSGYLHAGVPPSGPLDPTAHAAANLAVGNGPGAAALEIPLGSLRVVVSGGPVAVSIDGAPAMHPEGELAVSSCERAV